VFLDQFSNFLIYRFVQHNLTSIFASWQVVGKFTDQLEISLSCFFVVCSSFTPYSLSCYRCG